MTVITHHSTSHSIKVADGISLVVTVSGPTAILTINTLQVNASARLQKHDLVDLLNRLINDVPDDNRLINLFQRP